jgi:4'-phosphopantetheinyl transferase
MTSCHVWWAHTADAQPRLRALLDDVEHTRLLGFARATDRDRFLAGAALLRLAVASRCGLAPVNVSIDRTCRRCGEPHGKPRLDPELRLELSVTHSGGLVAVAVSDAQAVGVDVEQVRAVDVDALAPSVLTPQERAAVSADADPAVAFLRAWTRKEAVAKAIGEGLRLGLNTFSAGEETVQVAGRELQLVDLDPPEPGYVAALAVSAGADTIELHDGTPILRSGA